MQNTIVIGGGILGCMISCALLRAGAGVTQIVGGAPRASDASLVWLNVSSASDPAYAALRLDAMHRWQRLVAAETAPIRPMGALMWEDGLDCAAETARLSGMGWSAQAIVSSQFRDLAPGVAQPPETALFMPDEGACDPARIMDWAESRLDGVTRRTGQAEALVTRGDRITGVRVDGADIAADTVVIAAGVGCVPLLADIGIDVPLRHAPGMLVRTAPVPRVARPVMATPVCDWWQDGSGRLIVATDWDKVLEDAAPAAAADKLAQLADMMPAIGTPEIETLMERNRPVPGDGFPLVGQVRDGCWLAVTHSGMTLAPVIADAIASGVTWGADTPLLSPFRPARLCGDQVS